MYLSVNPISIRCRYILFKSKIIHVAMHVVELTYFVGIILVKTRFGVTFKMSQL